MTAYTGVQNLEAMEEAHNYYAFLTDLVEQGGGAARSALDFGAGTGTMARALTARGWSVGCVEPDPDLRAGALQSFATFASLADVPTASVAYLYTLNVLEHVADDAACLAEIRRVLAPGGRLLVYVPAFHVLWTAMDDRVGHVRRYRRRELVERVRAAGLTIDASAYADCLGFGAALAWRVVGTRDGLITPASVRHYDRFLFPASRALDAVTGRRVGKNVYVTAHRG